MYLRENAMTQTAIVVHRSKSKMIRLFLGALVFVALGRSHYESHL